MSSSEGCKNPIMDFDYSRGGAYTVSMAKRLDGDKIPVCVVYRIRMNFVHGKLCLGEIYSRPGIGWQILTPVTR